MAIGGCIGGSVSKYLWLKQRDGSRLKGRAKTVDKKKETLIQTKSPKNRVRVGGGAPASL